MKKLLLGLMVGTALIAASPVMAIENVETLGAVRSSSQWIAYLKVCPEFFAVNVKQADDYAVRFYERLISVVGHNVAKVMLEEEVERRKLEVKITEARPWCFTTRAFLESVYGQLAPHTEENK